MLNRLFIVVGVLAILAIVGLFAAPFFLDWSSYRARMEAIASEALGTDVHIRGEFNVMVLPQPRVTIDTVSIGPSDAPIGEIASAEAEFSLMDFLRDRYAVTRLVLKGPKLFLDIDKDGRFNAPLMMPETVGSANVSIADAEIEDGSILLRDARSGESWEASGFDGKLQAGGLRGPFTLSGGIDFSGKRHEARITTTPMNSAGELQVNAFVRPEDRSFSGSFEGLLSSGPVKFKGKMVLRQAPAGTDSAGGVRGDAVLTSDIEADTGQILLSNYVIEPDENRPATRLTGAAVIALGSSRSFDAVISGGVVGLAPRDARAENSAEPYELVRLIGELPAPPKTGMPGRLSLDVSELDLHGIAVRDVRLDARTDGEVWQIATLNGKMPGDTQLGFRGELRTVNGRPWANGDLSLDSARLDALALQWRSQGEGNPLFSIPASLSGKVALNEGAFALENGRLVFDGISNAVSAGISTGDKTRLDFALSLGDFDAVHSRSLLALLPDVAADASFAASFAEGGFDLSASTMTLFDLAARKPAMKGNWGSGGMTIDHLTVEDIGGMRLDLSGSATGTIAAPVLAGEGHVSLSRGANAGAVMRFLDAVAAPAGVRTIVAASLPAELAMALKPEETGGEMLSLRGRAGSADLAASLTLAEGIAKAFSAPVTTAITLTAQSPEALSAQIGLPAIALVPDGPAVLTMTAEGAIPNSLEMVLSLEGGGDRTQFSGNVIVSDPERLRGRGKVEFKLGDATPFAELAGVEGLGLAGVEGAADVSFTGTDTITFSGIRVESDGALFAGELARNVQGGDALISGTIRASTIDIGGLAALIGGRAALAIPGDTWPDGPFDTGASPRLTRGRIHVEVPVITSGERQLASAAAFDLAWDGSEQRVRGFEATVGGGKLGLEIALCCAGVQAERQVNGRLTLSGVDIDAVLPQIPAGVLGGRLDGGLTVTATGGSFAAIMAGLTGEGSFSLKDIRIERLDPGVLATAVAVSDILELEPGALDAMVVEALAKGPFEAAELGGVFTIARGIARTANLAASGEAARLVGGGSLSLGDLSLGGTWTMTPVAGTGSPDALSELNAGVTANVSGTLLQPVVVIETGQMTDALKVRAYELEVERLEALRAQQEARARAEAEERARLMELEARRKAQEELARAQAEAEKLKLEEETRRALQELADQLGPSQDPLLQQNQQGAPIDLLGPPPADQ